MEQVAEANLRSGATDRERALIDAAIGGDAHAFAALYDLHLERVYRHVYYRVGNRADAEDLSQQVFLQAWQAIGRYRQGGAPFSAWLLTIAHNLAINFQRRAKSTTPLDGDDFELELRAQERWPSPEAEVLTQFDRLAIRRAVLRLNPEQQQVIMMRFFDQFDYAAVAAALGKREGNIRVIQHRALLELRRLLRREAAI